MGGDRLTLMMPNRVFKHRVHLDRRLDPEPTLLVTSHAHLLAQHPVIGFHPRIKVGHGFTGLRVPSLGLTRFCPAQQHELVVSGENI